MKTFLRFIYVAAFFWVTNAQAYDLVTSPYLSGDWGGERTNLADHGLIFNLGYGSEIAHNFTGGNKLMTEYTDQWVVGVALDSEKMGFWKGGTARITMTDRNGHNLGGDAGIGNDMLLQEVYGRGQTLHMTQFWFNQTFFDNMVEWKLGRMLAGEDFSSFSCDFQNLSFCGAQPGNIVGSYWINWPTSVWATRVKVHVGDEIYVQAGAFDVNPKYVSDSYEQKYGWGLDDPTGSTGTLLPVEFAWKPMIDSRPGSYKFGAWYNSARAQNIGDPMQYSSQYGAYIDFEQQITGTVEEPGFSVFLNIAQADRTTAAVDRQISLGTEYRNPFHRRLDIIGFAVGATDNNPAYATSLHTGAPPPPMTPVVGSGTEFDWELYYSYSPITSVFFRPNIQYVLDPGGTGDNKNAFVLGLKTGVTL